MKLSPLSCFLPAIAGTVCVSPTLFASDAKIEKPNVVILFCDDMGYADTGIQGAKYPTPHLDKLAEDGTRFTRFYVPHPVSSPSRAALLTGCYAQRFGINNAIAPGAKTGLPNTVQTLPSLFKKQGYATGIFGKWHLGERENMVPPAHGFDEFVGTIVSHDYGGKGSIPVISGNKENVIIAKPKPEQLTKISTEGAVRFIEKHAKENFFLYVPYNLPHVPLGATAKNKSTSKNDLYAATMRDIDDSVGAILAKIDALKLREKTIVIFSSDNGPWLNYGNHSGSATPLRQGKGTVYEGGVRVPFFIRWPEKIPAKRICDAPFMSIDLLPSLAEPVGYPLPAPLDGHNVWPLLTGKTDTGDIAYWFSYGGQAQAFTRGKWKVILPHTTRYYVPEKNENDGKAGKTESRKIASPELYDLTTDIGESRDLSAEFPEVLNELLRAAKPAPWADKKTPAK